MELNIGDSFVLENTDSENPRDWEFLVVDDIIEKEGYVTKVVVSYGVALA